MKWIIPLAIIAVFMTSGSQGQIKQGILELSLSGNFGTSSGSTEQTGAISFKSDQPAEGYLSFALRPGYYVIEGLVVEPELLWTATEESPPSFSFTGNLAYHFVIPQSRMAPFVLVGYGKANGIPRFQQSLQRATDGFDVSVLNIGAGMKFFVALRVALRVEYRLQRYGYETSSGLSGVLANSIKTTRVFHNFFFGLSYFFQ
jgi:opacity protein-like surface antigen